MRIQYIPLGSALRWGFLRLKCVAKYFVLFSFSHTPFLPSPRLEKTESVYVLFALGKYKLNGIHISYALSLSLSLWIVLCCCDLRKMFQQHLYSFSCSETYLLWLFATNFGSLNVERQDFSKFFACRTERNSTQHSLFSLTFTFKCKCMANKILGNFRMVFEPSANECCHGMCVSLPEATEW